MSNQISIGEIQILLNDYCKWFNNSSQLQKVDHLIEITTPFIDRHNDLIQIFVNKENNEYVLSDYGYILQDLESSGFTLDTQKRKSAFSVILNGFGIKEDKGFLKVRTQKEDFSLKYQNLLQAILAVNDLQYLAEPKPTPVFVEEVHSWLRTNKVRYEEGREVIGYSGLKQTLDIFIPKFAGIEENGNKDKIIQLIDPPNTSNIRNFVLQWGDIVKNQENRLKGYAALNNEIRRDKELYRIPNQNINALRKYSIVPLYWNSKDELIGEFVKKQG